MTVSVTALSLSLLSEILTWIRLFTFFTITENDYSRRAIIGEGIFVC